MFSFLPSNNVALAMAYVITYSVTVGSNVIASTTATFTYVNPCPTTTLSWITTPSAMAYTVSATASIQTATVRDQVSISCGGPNACGAYTYSISDSTASGVTALTTSELTISSAGVISVATSNTATAGVHTATVSVSLASYANVVLSTTFTFTISASLCVILSIQVV